MKEETTKKFAEPSPIHTLPKEEQLVWLMEEYGDMVIRLAFTYVKQKQIAEDISQDVFISCFKNLEQFEKRSSYKTWVYRITVNKCKDYLKSWSFKNIFYKDILNSYFKSKIKSTDDAIVDKEEKEFIFERVLSLPVKLREVIILHYYEELSIKEIGELLNFNSNTVKTRLHRGRHSLKMMLKEDILYER